MLDMNHYIEISHRAYWRRTGAYDAFFRNRPTNKALEFLKILTCVPVATVRARSRFAWKQAQRCVRPCGTPCTRWEECTLHKPWSAQTSTHEHWHIHYSSRTPPGLAYTQHPNRAFTHIAIAFTRHPTVAALAPHPPQSNSHHRNTHHIDMSKPKVGTRPAPSRHRSPTLSQTVRGHRHSPNTISRCRKNLPRSPPAPRCEHASV